MGLGDPFAVKNLFFPNLSPLFSHFNSFAPTCGVDWVALHLLSQVHFLALQEQQALPTQFRTTSASYADPVPKP
eukprot:2759257-Amphidinium_carterae.1